MGFCLRKGPPPRPFSPYIYYCYILYINILLLYLRWDEQCRNMMMTIPPQLISFLPSFSYPARFRYLPPTLNIIIFFWIFFFIFGLNFFI